jgi:glycosyltransferase involved in cell wall biosynthesis
MMNITLSVIISNYNHAHYIGEALEAILNQSFRPQEVIVVDDGSTDNSVEVIKAFAHEYPIVRLYRNDQNRGVVFSFNRGLEIASGEYVYGAAADDKVLPGLFEKSMKLLARYPQAGLCCSDPVWFDGRTGIVRENRLYLSDSPCYFPPGDIVQMQRHRCFHIAGYTSLMKRSAVVEAGKMIPELRWNCDWFILFVIGFRYGICYIPEPLAAWRLLPSSYSTFGNRNWPAQREALNHMLHLLKSPAYRDVAPLFKRTGILSIFHSQILRVLLSNPEYQDYLTSLLIRRALWREFKILGGRFAPSSVKRMYHHVRERHQQKQSYVLHKRDTEERIE